MKGWTLIAAFTALLATPALAADTPPNLRACPSPASPDGGERERTMPLPVPAALRTIVRSSLYHYAVSTLRGGTVCDDVSWVNEVSDVALTPDRRFLSYRWYGYETYGYKLIDRTGRGQVHDIGAKPVFSPSRQQFAAIDQTEAEFGTISGLMVWRVLPGGIAESGKVEDIPRMYDWRIDGWSGEACLNLSAIPHERMQDDPVIANARRDRFIARPAGLTWRVLRAVGPNHCPR